MSFRHFVVSVVPFPLRRALARLRAVRGPADVFGRWSAGGWRASIARGVTARRWRHVEIGRESIIESGTHFHSNDDGDALRIRIAERCFVGPHCFFSAGEAIDVARHCNIGAACNLLGAGHLYDHPTTPYSVAPVVSYGRMQLGSNTWIGVGSTLVGNVTIGFGTVVAAGSLVRTSLPPLCLAAGHPASIVKLFDWPRQVWVRLPVDQLARAAALQQHLATIPPEVDYIRQLG
jgi:acetyltransferase-like isoleucine patch superfamily enzyme